MCSGANSPLSLESNKGKEASKNVIPVHSFSSATKGTDQNTNRKSCQTMSKLEAT